MNRVVKNIISFAIIIIMGVLMVVTVKTQGSSNATTMSPSSNQQSQGTPPDMSNDMQNGSNTPPDMPNGNNMSGPLVKPDGNDMNMDMPSSMTQPKDSDNNMLNILLCSIEGLILSLVVVYLIMSKLHQKTFKETFSNIDKKIIYALSVILLTATTVHLVNLIPSDSSSNSQMPNIQNTTNVSFTSPNKITTDTTKTSGDYKSSSADENALLVSGKIDVELSNINVEKTGDSDGGDNTSFYGMNSAILAKGGANLDLKNITVETNAAGANGVFSYGGSATTQSADGDGTTINISDSRITTKKDNSGGIMTTGGGITNAKNLIIETAGISSAAIRTDRGGGAVTVDGGTYKTTGQGSPTIYSTADITVKNAELVATASEGIVIEGKNKVTIENTKLTDTNNKLNGQSTTYKNIFLYQSMSGDADTGTSEFTAKNSEIITNKGDSFYVTNTSSKIYLSNNTIINNDPTGNFLRVQKDSWGKSGANGGIVELTLSNQKISGNIVVDSISILDMDITDSSYYEGIINGGNNAKEINLVLDESSKIKLTGDSYISSLKNSGSNNIDLNGYTLYVNGQAY